MCTNYPKEGIDKERLLNIFKKYKDGSIRCDKCGEVDPVDPMELWTCLNTYKTFKGRYTKTQCMLKFAEENNVNIVVNPLKKMIW